MSHPHIDPSHGARIMTHGRNATGRGDAAVYLALTLLAASGCMNGAYSDVVELSISIPDETTTTEDEPTTGTIGDTVGDDGTTSATGGSETESGSTDTFPSSCGDGEVQDDEECDDGNQSNADSCLNTCTQATCGDGYVQGDFVEECDDGNDEDGDGCS